MSTAKKGNDDFELSADELAKQEGRPKPTLAKKGGQAEAPTRKPVEVDQALPGMEDVIDQPLLDAAGRYLASKADFKRASEIVTQDKDYLFELMGQRQKEVYEHAGIRISIVKTTKRSIKVETFADPTSDESVGAESSGQEGEPDDE